MWDVLATSYLSIPEAFHLETARIAIIPKGPNAGQTQFSDHGPLVRIAKSVELSYFYEYLLTTFRN
jgi:purine nucleosidase